VARVAGAPEEGLEPSHARRARPPGSGVDAVDAALSGRPYRWWMPKRPARKTRRFVAQAYEDAKRLGPLRPVEAAARRSDGSPQAVPGQVYATWTGQVYHPVWCKIVGNLWDQTPSGLLVILESDVGLRRSWVGCARTARSRIKAAGIRAWGFKVLPRTPGGMNVGRRREEASGGTAASAT